MFAVVLFEKVKGPTFELSFAINEPTKLEKGTSCTVNYRKGTRISHIVTKQKQKKIL